MIRSAELQWSSFDRINKVTRATFHNRCYQVRKRKDGSSKQSRKGNTAGYQTKRR
jgi:hypothetical protein